MNLRVLSYNIHKGFNSGNRSVVLNSIRDSIRFVNADIVLLQEVVGENTRHAATRNDWISAAQFEFLADSVWPYHAYGKNALYDHGHHGNAILSKFPLIGSFNHDVSIGFFSRRGILHAETDCGVHILCVHFGLLAWERHHQVQALMRCIQKIPVDSPLIVAGDFNDWRQQTHRQLLDFGLREALHETYGQPRKTFPAFLPLLRMDRIYFRNLQLQSARRLDNWRWDSLSDHRPLFAEFFSKAVTTIASRWV
jgi:endonuclease/exonuclease/phosphatase family metal-dependent hydrolase